MLSSIWVNQILLHTASTQVKHLQSNLVFFLSHLKVEILVIPQSRTLCCVTQSLASTLFFRSDEDLHRQEFFVSDQGCYSHVRLHKIIFVKCEITMWLWHNRSRMQITHNWQTTGSAMNAFILVNLQPCTEQARPFRANKKISVWFFQIQLSQPATVSKYISRPVQDIKTRTIMSQLGKNWSAHVHLVFTMQRSVIQGTSAVTGK